MPLGKPTATTSAAAGKKMHAIDPTGIGDKCFLCGHTIGEGVAPAFYQGKNAALICHRSCHNQMEMVGGTPKVFHEYHANRKTVVPPVHDKPVHQDVETSKAVVETEWRGPRSIQFDTFADLQTFIVNRGAIPEQVRVAVGTYVMQAGG